MKDFQYYLNSIGEICYVEETTSSIIYASGLPEVKPGELVLFETKDPSLPSQLGQVLSFNENSVELLFFSKDLPTPGTKIVRTNELLKIPLGDELLGNVIDPLGKSLEDKMLNIKPTAISGPINTLASGITTRKSIKRHFVTGVPIVDLLLPLGYGQKQLIIGDRKTGKTDFLLQSVLTQAKLGKICVYGAIGKRKLDIKKLRDVFVNYEIMDRIVIVASGPQDPTSLIYLTPYSAMTISEYFRDEGHDVLLVLDDLSTHAKFYREISLLGKKFPGRNSYPGDIFYTHASLLERAGNFITPNGERAITCLPVAETIQGDLSGYIQTNLMSMTDGHLYFDTDFFGKGRRPAINPFLSVTRVGKQTQSIVKREITREILSFLTLFEKMQSFTHFGAELNETTKVTISVGQELIKFFQQQPSSTIPINAQILLFCLLWLDVVQKFSFFEKKEDIEKIIRLYETREDFRKYVNSTIETAISFNKLLGTIRQKKDEISQFYQ